MSASPHSFCCGKYGVYSAAIVVGEESDWVVDPTLAGINLIGGTSVQCASCHDVHVGDEEHTADRASIEVVAGRTVAFRFAVQRQLLRLELSPQKSTTQPGRKWLHRFQVFWKQVNTLLLGMPEIIQCGQLR